MLRRHFITLLGGAAAAQALGPPAVAEPAGRMRLIGVINGFAEADVEARQRFEALRAGLRALGWIEGQNLRVEMRWAAGDIGMLRRQLEDLLSLGPDLIVTGHTVGAQAMQQTRPPVPTIFVGIADPLASGVVASLARPGGHITGFTAFEYAIGGKWLSLLMELAPRTERVALLFSSKTAPWAPHFWHAFQSAAPMYNVQAVGLDMGEPSEIRRALEDIAREPNGALLAVPEPTITIHRALVLELADKYRLPAVFPYRHFAAEGALASYGIDLKDMWRRSASYIDRILKGEKPADLPVQAPTKYEFVINLKTARALGIEVPPALQLRADEVIE